MMNNQVRKLFQRPASVPDWKDTIQSAANGVIKLAWVRREQRENVQTPWYQDTLEIARELGLTVVTRPVALSDGGSIDFPLIDVFVLRPEESWRIERLIGVNRRLSSDCLWSDNMEFLSRELIGHSTDRLLELQTADRHNRLGWIGQTAYLLLCANELAHLKEVGMRCFFPDTDISGMQPFSAGRNGRLKGNVGEFVPDGLTLCRFALANIFSIGLFEGDGVVDDSELVVQSKFDCTVSTLNIALRSPIELWSESYWQSPQDQPYPGQALRVNNN